MYNSSNIAESRKCFLENHRNSYLVCALYDAIIDADLATVKYLLEFKNVNPNFLVSEYDAAPLHAAPGISIEIFAYNVVNVLIAHGAEANIKTSDGTTPLMISCLWGRESIVTLLLINGADPFIKDLDGLNSFDYAMESDNSNVYNLIHNFFNKANSVQTDVITTLYDDKFIDRPGITTTNETYEFTDIDSDANIVEFPSLDTGFRKINNTNDRTNEPGIDNNPLITSDDSNNTFKSARIFQTFFAVPEGKTEETSFASATSSSTQVSLTSYATDHIKDELKKNKIIHGPVTKTTKKVYRKLLAKVLKGNQHNVCEDEFSQFPEILRSTFKSNDILNKWYNLEKIMSNNFLDTKKLWRGGKEKQFFTYLLLDPFVTNNLPLRSNDMTDVEIWKTFILSIFYIGKGKNSRPFSHLYEALRSMKKSVRSSKVKRIQKIWDNSAGVICLHIFHNVMSSEAHTREAAMIDAVCLKNLTNIQNGEYYGVVKNWSIKQKIQLGTVLLYKALHIYLAEGERQIYATDLA